MAVFGGEILVIGGEGNGLAYDTVEGFDPVSLGWTTRAPLNYARHGTQAIVSGQGVYVAAGSPNQGGGNQRNMEAYNADLSSGVAGVAGLISAPVAVSVSSTTPAAIVLAHVSGNEGAFVNDVSLSGPDASDFAILTDLADPFLIRTSGNRGISVEYTGSVEGASASLDVTYGGTEPLSVALTGTLAPGSPGRVPSLRVGKNGADLELSWDGDCGGGDRVGIYRGDLSLGYDSLAIEGCDLPGTTATIPTGLPEGEFFLVVPSLGAGEGSYGRDTACEERPAALVPCHSPAVADPCASACD